MRYAVVLSVCTLLPILLVSGCATRPPVEPVAPPAATVQVAPPSVTPEIAELVAALQLEDTLAQARARQMLPRQGAAAVEALMPLLASDNPVTVRAAQLAIQETAYALTAPGCDAERRRVTDLLMAVAAAPDRRELPFALHVLERIVPDGYDISPIALLLRSDDATLRERAREALIRMATPESLAAIHAMLAEGDSCMQAAILNGLREYGNDSALLELARPLAASDVPQVRAAALRALAVSGNPEFVPLFAQAVADAPEEWRTDMNDAYLRIAAAMEKNEATRTAAKDAYVALLNSGESAVVQAAVAGLGRTGTSAEAPAIVALLASQDPDVRCMAVAAAAALPGGDITRALMEAYGRLVDDNSRIALLLALGKRQDAAVLEPLRAALSSSNAAVRQAGYEALVDSGQGDALSALVDAAEKAPEAERELAQRSLLTLAKQLEGKTEEIRLLKAYQCAYAIAADPDSRIAAVTGLAGHPSQASVDVALKAAADPGLKHVAPDLLTGVAAACAAAGKDQEAQQLLDELQRCDPNVAYLEQYAEKARKLGKEIDLAGLTGAIRKWQVVGPFPARDLGGEWSKDFIGEKHVDAKATYAVEGGTLAWKPVESSGHLGHVDLMTQLGANANCFGYAYAEVTVASRQVATIRASSDDGLAIWVNNAKVHDNFVDRGVTPDSDVVGIRLEAGLNRILFKISQGSGGWGYCARITDRDGRPIPFNQ